jgi:hypothetical protein
MSTLDPPVVIRPLSDVAPGSLVQLEGLRGFCAFNPRGPGQTRVMVNYDAERGAFRYLVTPAGVLDFGTNLLIVPDPSSLVSIDPNLEASTELLLVGDAAKIQFQLEAGDARQVDLKSGVIEPLTHDLVAAFRAWTVGVNTASGGFLPLLKIAPRPAGGDAGPPAAAR